jgi:hypothetical protein
VEENLKDADMPKEVAPKKESKIKSLDIADSS